jgi:hypothetical protein
MISKVLFRFRRLSDAGILLFISLWAPMAKIYFHNVGEFSITVVDLFIACTTLSMALTLLASPLISSKQKSGPVLYLGTGLVLAAVVNTYFIHVTPQVLEGLSTASDHNDTIRLFVVLCSLLGMMSLLWARKRRPSFSSGILASVRLFLLVHTLLFALVVVWQTMPLDSRFLGALTSNHPVWQLSREHNIIILSFDQMQGSATLGVLRKYPQLAEMFEGFEAFPDAASVYPNTNYSLASVLRGRIARRASDNLGSAISGSNFINEASARGYDARYVLTRNARERERVATRYRTVLEFALLLSVSVRQAYGLNADLVSSVVSIFAGHPVDDVLLQYFWKLDIPDLRLDARTVRSSGDQPVIEFRHYFASHQPLVYDKDCTIKQVRQRKQDLSGVEDEVYCVLSSVAILLNRLRTLELFDHTLVIISSDHGYERNINLQQNHPLARDLLFSFSDTLGVDNIKPAGAYNPTLLFKDFEKSGPLRVNYAPASLLDIAATVCETLGGCGLELEGESLRNLPNERKREYWRYYGGAKDRYAGGKDRLHHGLDEWWEIRSFEGSLAQGLVSSVFPSSPPSGQIRLGQELVFTSGGNSAQCAVSGWSSPEPNHHWTVGKKARLVLDLEDPVEADLLISLDAEPFLAGGGLPHQKVDALVDGEPIATWKVDRRSRYQVRIPRGLAKEGFLDVVLLISDPTRPCDVIDSNDCRELGISLRGLKIDYAQ